MKKKISLQKNDIAQVGRGVLMGGANIIPGVSGGTVALILGIYQRLIAAISHVDLKFLKLLRDRQFSEAAAHVDFRFLATLGLGVVLGTGLFANLLDHLMKHHLALTLSAFFGLILASSILVAKMVRPKSRAEMLGSMIVGLMSACFAFWLVGMEAMANPPEGPAYLFVCSMIAICAMILPGISGSFMLIILGPYQLVIDMIKGLTRLQFSVDQLTNLLIVGLGCVTGLLCFSRVLRWLLAHYHGTTMTVLCGLMIGSLHKIWPYQHPTDKGEPLDTYLPETFDQQAMLCLGVAVTAFIMVLIVERIAGGTRIEESATRE